MSECSECREQMYPRNPQVGGWYKGKKEKWGRYIQPICHGCPNGDYKQYLRTGNWCDDYSINIEPPDYNTAMAVNRRIDSLLGELAYTRNKINSILDKKKKEMIIIEGGEGTIR